MACFLSWTENVILTIILFGSLYYYWLRNFNYFERNGIKYMKPLPLVGHMGRMVILKEHLIEIVNRHYKMFKNEKYFGMFSYSTPVIVIKDLEVIKQILIKDFYNFTDHPNMVDDQETSLFHSVYCMKGEKWREMRTILSPIFSNSKLESKMYFVERCTSKFIEHLKAKNLNTMEVYIKELLSTFCIDVMLSCSFGIEIDSLDDPNNGIYNNIKDGLNLPPLGSVIADIVSFNPILRKVISGRYMEKKTEEFWRQTYFNIMDQRSKSEATMEDMIHLLASASSGRLHDEDIRLHDDMGYVQHDAGVSTNVDKKVWTEEEIMAQPVLYLLVGYEYVLIFLNTICYLLAVHPEVQEKLHEEIVQYLREKDNVPNNLDIYNLKYLDMVLWETLRLWPHFGKIDRVCTDSYSLPPPNNVHGKKLTIQKGQIIWIPIYSLHMDPQYFPEPEKFIPERFSDENKGNIKPMSFLAFGAGQRSCPGSHFVLAEVKIFIFHFLANFEITKTAKTEVSMKIRPHAYILHPKNLTHLRLTRRNEATISTNNSNN